MSVKVYFYKNDERWTDDQTTSALEKVPQAIRERIMAYKDSMDRQSRIAGKLLLQKMAKDFGLSSSLSGLKYSEYNKPYLDGDADFSITHTDGMVVCAGAMRAKIGIDVERIRELDVKDYRDQLTVSEWYLINHSKTPSKTFLEMWTKKEALLKATGRGIAMDMSYIDVTSKVITVHQEQFSFCALPIDDTYMCNMAIYVDFRRQSEVGINYDIEEVADLL